MHNFGLTRVECLTIISPAIGVELESIPTATEGARAVGTLTITTTVDLGTFIDVCNIMTDYAYLVCEYTHVNVFIYYVLYIIM